MTTIHRIHRFLGFGISLILVIGAITAIPASAQESPTLIDLTHPFDKNTIYWPTEPGFKFDVAARGVTEKGYFYAANRFATAEHGGTHIDAPIHFFADRETVDQIPLWRLVGPGGMRRCFGSLHRES